MSDMETGSVWCDVPEDLLGSDLAMEFVAQNLLEWAQDEGASLLEGPPRWVQTGDGYGQLVYPVGRRRDRRTRNADHLQHPR